MGQRIARQLRSHKQIPRLVARHCLTIAHCRLEQLFKLGLVLCRYKTEPDARDLRAGGLGSLRLLRLRRGTSEGVGHLRRSEAGRLGLLRLCGRRHALLASLEGLLLRGLLEGLLLRRLLEGLLLLTGIAGKLRLKLWRLLLLLLEALLLAGIAGELRLDGGSAEAGGLRLQSAKALHGLLLAILLLLLLRLARPASAGPAP